MTKSVSTQSLRVLVLTTAIYVLTSCAQYQVRTNKELGYSKSVECLYVWSAVGEIDLLHLKRPFHSDSFENQFHAALKQSLMSAGVVAEVRAFSPKGDRMVDLIPFENDLKPNMRLVIQPTRYQMMTSSRGGSRIGGLWLDLSMYEVATNRRVWRAELFADAGLDMTVWMQTGAENLATQIVDALRKDRLLADAKKKLAVGEDK